MVKKAKAHYGIASPITWVWGDKKKGVSVFKVISRGVSKKFVSSWTVYLWKNGRVSYRQINYPTKAEALREAAGYAKHFRSFVSA